jgi:hypothetical protein
MFLSYYSADTMPHHFLISNKSTMKRAFLLSLAAAFLVNVFSASAQVAPAKKEETKAKVKTQNVKMKVKGNLSAVPLPYSVEYSSQFIMGDPAHAKTVLDLWKDFDNNTFDRNPGAFADTVTINLADGTRLQGLQQVMDGAKTYRSALAAMESAVSAVMSVHSIDRDENWVLVWGESTETDKNGQKKTTALHEAWRLNKDGKVDLMLQYTHAAPKM